MMYENLKYVNEIGGIQADRISDGIAEYFEPNSDNHSKAVSGAFGPIAEYSPRPEPDILENAKREVRAERDNLLRQSDWTQVADAPVDQAAWATYRQALRDVPQQDGFPEDIAWPAPPAA
mgnify:CR=1 FL=1